MIQANSQSLPALVSERLNISVMSLANSARTGRIVRHYLDQIADGHMTLADAVERCCGDICGRNYGQGEQRSTPILRGLRHAPPPPIPQNRWPSLVPLDPYIEFVQANG